MWSLRKLMTALFSLSIGLAGYAQYVVAEQVLGEPGTRLVSLDVQFVPTPQPVVDEMLKLADLDKNDVLYDLGSGDGRIVITAAERYGVRGVGIDLDPDRIAESNSNAEQAGVTDRVKFIQGDLFEADFSEATAVTLYLLSSLNMRLRPKLLRELRPGTPVVSHSFDMGDWEPDKTVSVDGNMVYLWIIPADVQGKWNLTVQEPNGGRQVELNLGQEFQVINGTARIDGAEVPVENGRVEGDRLVFSITYPTGGEGSMQTFSGRINGDSIQGTTNDQGSGSASPRTWTAERTPATAVIGDRLRPLGTLTE